MTAEQQQTLAQRALSLQLRLSHGRVDPLTAAGEAKGIFLEEELSGGNERLTWLGLELGGYGHLADSRPLHVVLGVPASDRLAAQVAAYRSQRGTAVGGPQGGFRHFFVEPLGELVRVRADVAAQTDSNEQVQLEFGPHAPDPTYPRSATFDRDVFGRIVSGFIAALHLQLGELFE